MFSRPYFSFADFQKTTTLHPRIRRLAVTLSLSFFWPSGISRNIKWSKYQRYDNCHVLIGLCHLRWRQCGLWYSNIVTPGSINLSFITSVSGNIDKSRFDVICEDSRTFSFEADKYVEWVIDIILHLYVWFVFPFGVCVISYYGRPSRCSEWVRHIRDQIKCVERSRGVSAVAMIPDGQFWKVIFYFKNKYIYEYHF